MHGQRAFERGPALFGGEDAKQLDMDQYQCRFFGRFLMTGIIILE